MVSATGGSVWGTVPSIVVRVDVPLTPSLQRGLSLPAGAQGRGWSPTRNKALPWAPRRVFQPGASSPSCHWLDHAEALGVWRVSWPPPTACQRRQILEGLGRRANLGDRRSPCKAADFSWGVSSRGHFQRGALLRWLLTAHRQWPPHPSIRVTSWVTVSQTHSAPTPPCAQEVEVTWGVPAISSCSGDI